MCPAFILTLTLKRAKLEYKIRSVSIDRHATINIGVRDRGQGGGGEGLDSTIDKYSSGQ